MIGQVTCSLLKQLLRDEINHLYIYRQRCHNLYQSFKTDDRNFV